ncbi:signal peptidase I [Caulobacter sp. NIBR1757]|uniref:signal peptidase I n=1 Tax=Caulobacter sp. NIBR1757 TaxID=3016000 RepID=UPI0022F0819C|nr:signal peptidase I [Caulobacter sp. NIBR1757]
MTDAADPPKPTLLAETLDILRTVAIALGLTLVFRIVAWQPFTIPSSSMEPGLVTGDYIVVSKFAYGWSRASFPFAPPLFEGRVLGNGPTRGEVVVFRSSVDPDKTLVKRVIGLPGDRVRVTGGVVSVNGVAIPRLAMGPAEDRDDPDVHPLRFDERLPDGRTWATFDRGQGPGDDTDVYVVPEGQYFMMGDNRDNSLDSRWPTAAGGVGFVAAQDIVGRADMVLASWHPGAGLLKPWTWLDLQWDRFFKQIG